MIDLKSTLKNISIDYESGRKLITLMVEDISDQTLSWMTGKELRVTVKEWKKKRSLDANAYYWLLVGKLASKMQMSTTEIHNRMLMEYGIPEEMDGQLVTVELPDTFEAERKAYRSETYHLKPTSETYMNGDMVKRKWLLIRGSHEYNTAEFSTLLNGLIEECKWQGIPTDTPEQIERMLALYEQNKHIAR